MRNIDNMTFSGLHRYATICETVLQSDCHLSPLDRLELIHSLLDDVTIHTKHAIHAACAAREAQCIEYNIASASWARRGGF